MLARAQRALFVAGQRRVILAAASRSAGVLAVRRNVAQQQQIRGIQSVAQTDRVSATAFGEFHPGSLSLMHISRFALPLAATTDNRITMDDAHYRTRSLACSTLSEANEKSSVTSAYSQPRHIHPSLPSLPSSKSAEQCWTNWTSLR